MDRKTRWLTWIALQTITCRNELADIYNEPLYTGLNRIAQFLLADGWQHFTSQLPQFLVGHDDVALMPLPRPFWFLYPILRVPLLLWRRLSRRGHR